MDIKKVREEFEKLNPVPNIFVWNNQRENYVLAPETKNTECAQTELANFRGWWQGFLFCWRLKESQKAFAARAAFEATVANMKFGQPESEKEVEELWNTVVRDIEKFAPLTIQAPAGYITPQVLTYKEADKFVINSEHVLRLKTMESMKEVLENFLKENQNKVLFLDAGLTLTILRKEQDGK